MLGMNSSTEAIEISMSGAMVVMLVGWCGVVGFRGGALMSF